MPLAPNRKNDLSFVILSSRLNINLHFADYTPYFNAFYGSMSTKRAPSHKNNNFIVFVTKKHLLFKRLFNQKDAMIKFGYTLFYVDDVIAAISFYKSAFGLESGFVDTENKQYGELITGNTKLGFVNHKTASTHGFEYEKSNLNKKSFAVEVGFITDNVQNSYEKAISAGAIATSPPTLKPWGQTVAYVRDPNGFLIELCTSMS